MLKEFKYSHKVGGINAKLPSKFIMDHIQEFSNLLNEHHSKIFAFLNIPERQRARAVCKTWCNIINEDFGYKISVKNSTSDLITTCPWANDVELNSMTKTFESGISFASRLHSLSFSNIVVSYNLISFLRQCSSIKRLTFLNVVLDIPIDDPWNPELTSLSLPQLSTIEFKCWSFTDGVLEIMKFLNSKVTFEVLREIIISSQNPPTLALQMIFNNQIQENEHPLIQLVKRNKETLNQFCMGRISAPIVFEFHEFGCFEGNPLQLKQFIINPYFREEWASILLNQSHIETLQVGSVNVNRWEDINQGILRNSTTLKEFSMCGLSFGQSFDLSVFGVCSVLQKLSLEICHSPKIHLKQIPVQLAHLCIFGPIKLTEILAIATYLVNLNYLKFVHLGRTTLLSEQRTEKVNLMTFKNLLQLPKLKTLCFAICANISMDWHKIVSWCRNSEGPGFTFEESFYQLHGEQVREGITVWISEYFPRKTFDWGVASSESDSDSPDNGSSFSRSSFP